MDGDTEAPVTCPQCRKSIPKTVGELEAETGFTCPHCGRCLQPVGAEKAFRLHRKAIEDLRRKMRRMFR